MDQITPPEITVNLTPWFTRRMLIMLAMFGFFAAYFAYDWKVGYPKKASIYQEYLGYQAKGEEGMREWAVIAREKKYDLEDEKKLKPMEVDDGKIAQQFWGMIVCTVLSAITVYFLVRSLGTGLAIANEQLLLPRTPPIAISDIVRVDTRKWMSKGLAYVWYQSGGSEKKGVIDGLKYGGFKGEKPYAPDLILEHVVKNFRGELIELEEAPADTAATGSAGGTAAEEEAKQG